jgi:hypothetical protein
MVIFDNVPIFRVPKRNLAKISSVLSVMKQRREDERTDKRHFRVISSFQILGANNSQILKHPNGKRNVSEVLDIKK